LSVPSKFFGALAVGRPVVYAGPEQSDVARWIRSLAVGYELRPETRDAVVGALNDLTRTTRTSERSARVQAWDRLLGDVVRRRASS
jgi:hypothetical protein